MSGKIMPCCWFTRNAGARKLEYLHIFERLGVISIYMIDISVSKMYIHIFLRLGMR